MRIEAGSVYLGGLAAAEIAARFGTPLYVIETGLIQARYEQLVGQIPYRPLRVNYACKANANVQVMRFLRELGAHLDACSPGDLAFGDAAGFQPGEVFYTGCAMSDQELQLVAERGVWFNADSLSQLERYGRLAPGGAVGLRVNCGVLAGFHAHVQSAGQTSKFGLHPGQIAEARALADRFGIRITGLHTHLGSDLFEIRPPIRALDVLIELSDELPDLEFIDVGGGWGVPFVPGDPEFDMAAYGALVTERMAALSERRGRPIVFRVEPGAYLLSDAGVLLTRITELKPPVVLNDTWTPFFAGTDTSYNHCVSIVLYDSYHGILVADRADASANRPYDVVGNLMQAGDVLAKHRPLPDLQVDDLLVILNCGAYAACRAPTFNERPRPAEVLVAHGEARLARRAESVADLLAQQVY